MKTTAFIQARMGSTRLPGKVLLDLGGDTVLCRVVRRLSRATCLDQIVVATTQSPADDDIVRECDRLKVQFFRGSEDDVLDRYFRAAKAFDAQVIVRITSDCPLIEPALVDETVRVLHQERADYASNVFPRTYPRGLDAEVFSAAALERAWLEARGSYQREHVTPYFYEHPEIFRLAFAQGQIDYSAYRWTLDTTEDLQLVRAVYERFGNKESFGWREVIALMEREPELAELNSHVLQKLPYGA